MKRIQTKFLGLRDYGVIEPCPLSQSKIFLKIGSDLLNGTSSEGKHVGECLPAMKHVLPGNTWSLHIASFRSLRESIGVIVENLIFSNLKKQRGQAGKIGI